MGPKLQEGGYLPQQLTYEPRREKTGLRNF